MANLCTNDLLIVDSQPGLDEFLRKLVAESKASKEFRQAVMPFPSSEDPSPIFDLEESKTEDGKILITFYTMNRLAKDFAVNLAKAFPECRFKLDYFEPANSHAGQVQLYNRFLMFRHANGDFWDAMYSNQGAMPDGITSPLLLEAEPYEVIHID